MAPTETTPASVSYSSLPHKTQLFILMLVRFTEPLTTSSILSYVFFQLQHFDDRKSAADISTQIGLIVGCKTAAHVCTGLIWGRLADHERISRKAVLVFGLLASSLATVGYGFSTSFRQAILWQIVDGALNATIAMVRCMTSELNPKKPYRARALTLLPLAANIGSLLGPLVGGFLAPTSSASSILPTHPYAVPNICVASTQALVAVVAIIFLSDTFPKPYLSDSTNSPPIEVVPAFRPLNHAMDGGVDETSPLLPNNGAGNIAAPSLQEAQDVRIPFWKIWTPNVVNTMLAQFIISGHLGTFTSLWTVFLSLPVAPSKDQHPPFHFSGGLGLRPNGVGLTMSVFGFVGIVLQILVYPTLQERWGAIRVWRGALCLFPMVYLATPFCALMASVGSSQELKESASDTTIVVLQWSTLIMIMFLWAAGRTGVVPATSLLINDCTPHSSVRGTIHTMGVMVSNMSRSVFPPMALSVLGYGLKIGVVGLGFWAVAALAVFSILASLNVQEGSNGERFPSS